MPPDLKDTAIEQESRDATTPEGIESNGTGSPEPPAERLPAFFGRCFTCGKDNISPERDFCPNDPTCGARGPGVDEHRVIWYSPPRLSATFPVGSLSGAIPFLRAPFTKEAVRWKVQSALGDAGCLVVGYIDARLVIERLNLIVGGQWCDDYEGAQDNLMGCRLTVFDVTRYDVGEGKGKALRSDAFKRAAVKFGIGVSVYAIPQAKLWTKEHGQTREVEDLEGNTVKRSAYIESFRDSKNKTQFRITPDGELGLRERYQRWLDTRGIEAFGQPIDHGDLEDSAGESAEGEQDGSVSDLPLVALPLTDEKADTLRLHCRDVYATVAKSKLPKARFEAELKAASVSHDDLEAFRVRLTEMAK